MKKQAHDGSGQLAGVRIYSGLMPFVGPVHHSEKAEDGNARMDTRREAVGGDGVEDFASEGIVAALDRLDLFAVRIAQCVFLMGQDLHLVRV